MNPESPVSLPVDKKVACSKRSVSKRCVASQPLIDVVNHLKKETMKIFGSHPEATNQDFPWKKSHFDHGFFHENLQNSQQGHPVVVSGFPLTTGMPG